MNITEFLETRIAEDEQQASKHLPALSSHGLGDYGLRVLAECAAKRAIIEQVSDVAWGGHAVRDVILGHLASVYKEHADYQWE